MSSNKTWQCSSIHENFGVAADARRLTPVVISTKISIVVQNLLQNSFLQTRQIILSANTCNLENAFSVDSLFNSFNLTADQSVVFVLDDILPTLQDPRPLLRALRRALCLNTTNYLLLSLALRGLAVTTKPLPIHYIRQWAKSELLAFLEFGLFDVQEIKMADDIYCCIIRASQDFSDKKRQEMGLPPTSNQLLVFSEHADYCITGGIGTYVKEYIDVVTNKPLFLMTNVWHKNGEDICKKMGWFHLNQLVLPENYWEVYASIAYHGQILEAVLQILYLYEDVTSIEYQEYLGIGSRIAQAKRAGLIPPSICVVVSCHGGHPYIEVSNTDWYGKEVLPYFVAEKISIECADKAVLPSRFLAKLYKQQGITLPHEKILRYPFKFSNLDDMPKESKPIEQIVFFGKKCTMKGYQDFLKACIICAEKIIITQVLVIGPEIDVDAETRGLEDKLKLLTVNSHITLKRSEVQAYLKNLRSNSLVILPYLGDNHPMALMEVLDAAVPFVAYQAGGMPEMIPQAYHGLCMCLPNANSLADKIAECVASSNKRFENFWLMFAQVRQDQQHINAQYQIRHKVDVLNTKVVMHQDKNLVTVIVPVYNTQLSQIGDLITGLHAQRLQPLETIFIDDCSKPDYSEKLDAYLKANMGGLPYRLVRHDANKGLSAARNTGVSLAKTTYLATHDSDNIMCQNFLYDGVQALECNTDLTCITFFLQRFEDGLDFNDYKQKGYRYQPLGDTVLINLMATNELGDAMGVYRVDKIKALGGWDDDDKTAFEDWAFYLKLISQGEKMLVIPKNEALYRVREDSMILTYNRYDAWRRLPRGVKGMPIFDSYRLLGVLRSSQNYVTAPSEIQQVIEIIKARLRPYPRVKKFMICSLRQSLRVYRRLLR